MRIDIEVPDAVLNDWEISSFTVDEDGAKIHNIREIVRGTNRLIEPGEYKRLSWKGSMVMSNTPAEIKDHLPFIVSATGNVLITGLGLGMVAKALHEKEDVESITIVEKNSDVIKLVAPTYESYKKIKIIECDAFEFKSKEVFDFCWHDIWYTICFDNVKEMMRLKKSYSSFCKVQDFWCIDESKTFQKMAIANANKMKRIHMKLLKKIEVMNGCSV